MCWCDENSSCWLHSFVSSVWPNALFELLHGLELTMSVYQEMQIVMITLTMTSCDTSNMSYRIRCEVFSYQQNKVAFSAASRVCRSYLAMQMRFTISITLASISCALHHNSDACYSRPWLLVQPHFVSVHGLGGRRGQDVCFPSPVMQLFTTV